MVADSDSILNILKNHCCQLLHVNSVNDFRQTEVHTAQPLVAKPTAFEVEMIVEKFEGYKSHDTDQIPTEMIQALGRIVCFHMHKFIYLCRSEEELPQQWCQ